ncbi:aldose 1-epimerase [Polaribacter batillariae]|uniref:Aldose 1-epimerase n=1 Tax=Polaribacter batillariae TaxID=2808900 RepID=A0ABX7SRQ9_9FLAO|nr:aldose 1-epimerase [Polaribacter batillariae]QTD36917.1 aldose 1-epimerase [Polaribacter batillariae]
MFAIKEKKQNNFSLVELKNTANNSYASISLNEGARLQSLNFKGISIIEEQPNFDYKDCYSSAILFPFANRIEEGKYSYKNTKYQFKSNEPKSKNALHGLVFNKEFKILEKEITSNSCAVTIYYSERNECKSFPFKYSIYLTYTLLENELQLKVTVKNNDTKSFPFVLGWHPYFNCNNFKNSYLSFKSDKKISFDKNLITKDIINHKTASKFKLENKQLDDCFVLEDNIVQFFTSKYQLEISSTSEENFLQLYTPKNKPVIAIEPMTGISNSFNNKIGLQELDANKTYALTWTLKLL